MDDENIPLAEKCENLMVCVVESRKQLAKQCEQYHTKEVVLEMELLKADLHDIKWNSKPLRRHKVPDQPYDNMMEASKEVTNNMKTHRKRLYEVNKKLQKIENVVVHMQRDKISKLAKKPFTVETFLPSKKQEV